MKQWQMLMLSAAGVVGSGGIVLSGYTDLVLGAAVVGAAVLLAIVALWPQIAKLGQKGRYIPLAEAARLAYERTRTRVSGGVAERMGDVPADVLGWYAHALTGRGAATLYGKKAPARGLMEIPADHTFRFGFSDDLQGAFLWGDRDKIEYADLAIKRRDFRKRLKTISGWGP